MPEELQEAFSRIETAVESGEAGLGDLGFWRLVRQVKRDRRLSEHWADQVGRIDRMAFERSVRPRFPVWLGNAVLALGTAVLVAAIAVAIGLARDDPGGSLAGLLALIAAGGLSVTLHSPAHWLIGRLVGIRFTSYFLDGPTRIQPGLKSDYATYLRASPNARAWMHASGAIASKLAPFAVFAAVYVPHRSAGYDLLPSWSLWAILGIGVFQIFTDVVYSTRHSDWKKFRRERRVARTHAAGRTPQR